MKPLRYSLALAAAFLAAWLAVGEEQAAKPVTGILGAMNYEVTALQGQMADKQTQTILGIPFVTGELRGRRIVVARSGAGKVNAAMTATLLIDHFRPTEVVFTGIAGGINPDLKPGDLVIAKATAQHDMGDITPAGFTPDAPRNPVDGARNPVSLPADPRLLALAQSVAERIALSAVKTSVGERPPRVTTGVVVTGDTFIASSTKKAELRAQFEADAVEMEGAAVAQVCYEQKVPCLVVRSLSDNADETAGVDLEQFYATAADNAARFVSELVARLGSEP